MTSIGKTNSYLPPGFRFHPTDEELIVFYLRNQLATSQPCPVSIIAEVDIYKFDPWELPEKAEFGENEWYFFSPRDRKYPNGARPNRAAVSGYWKATGTDKAIYSCGGGGGGKYVGVKKSLVFYQGKPPKGVKTDWIMHEYRSSESRSTPKKHHGSMRLDDWVLCRIYKKKYPARASEEPKRYDVRTKTLTAGHDGSNDDDVQIMEFPRTSSISHLWELEYVDSISQLLNENSSSYDNKNTTSSNGGLMAPARNVHLGEMSHTRADLMKFQLNNQNSILYQPVFVNSTFEFQTSKLKNDSLDWV